MARGRPKGSRNKRAKTVSKRAPRKVKSLTCTSTEATVEGVAAFATHLLDFNNRLFAVEKTLQQMSQGVTTLIENVNKVNKECAVRIENLEKRVDDLEKLSQSESAPRLRAVGGTDLDAALD